MLTPKAVAYMKRLPPTFPASTASILLLLVLGLWGGARVANADGPKLGAPAPPLPLARLLQAPEGAAATWEALRGQVVVIDFWATWCPDCLAALPHWNKLVVGCSNQPVRFLAITDENEQVVRAFLRKRPMNSWIGIEPLGQSLRQTYDISAIPTTVLVNQQGLAVAVADPEHLEVKDILEIVKTGKSSLPPFVLETSGGGTPEKTPPPPLFQVSIRPSGPRPPGHPGNLWGQNSTGEMTGQFVNVASALSRLFDSRPWLVDCRTSLPTNEYDFTIRLPDNTTPAARTELLAAVFRTSFGLRVDRVRAEREVLVLGVVSTNSPGFLPARPDSREGGKPRQGMLNLRKSKLAALEPVLETWLRRPVRDETGLTNRYDVWLRWQMGPRELVSKYLDNRAVALALRPDAAEEKKLSPEAVRQLAAIRGTLPVDEWQALPSEDRENLALFRAELAKPEGERFAPAPEAILAAVREQLGLSLTPSRRVVETLVVEKAAPTGAR